MVCATDKPEDARKVLRSLEGMRQHGYELPDDILGEDEIHELEPALNDRVKAGFHLDGAVEREGRHDGRRARREAARDGRRDSSRAREVTGFDCTATRRARGPYDRRGEIAGDHFVLAAGSWTTPLAREARVCASRWSRARATRSCSSPKVMPRHGILFADIHAGVTPLGDRVRIGGTMEFSGYDLSIDERRHHEPVRARHAATSTSSSPSTRSRGPGSGR